MPRRDTFHDIVKNALVKDGWSITHDPYPLKFGEEDLQIDLGAEAPFGAEKAGKLIAVEVKSFLGRSPMTDLERALGQFTLYRFLLERKEADRTLYIAVSDITYEAVFNKADARDLLADVELPLLLFDIETEEIVKWIE